MIPDFGSTINTKHLSVPRVFEPHAYYSVTNALAWCSSVKRRGACIFVAVAIDHGAVAVALVVCPRAFINAPHRVPEA